MRIILASALFFLIACNSAEKKEDVKEGMKVEGAYKMLSANLKSDKTDTTDNSLQQIKIFTGDHMMYANVNSPDSVSSFGVGSYTIKGDTITEHVIYSASAAAKDDTARTYNLAIEKTAKGYKQVIADIGGINDTMHYKLTEEYENAGTETKTPLDGVWKLTKAIAIRGKDTTVEKVVAYKAYYAGNIIFGHTFTDSLNKNHTGVGFGKFEMTGDNKAKEFMKTSTYHVVRGKNFELDISLNGADEFTQTITDKDGSKGVETYQRLKK